MSDTPSNLRGARGRLPAPYRTIALALATGLLVACGGGHEPRTDARATVAVDTGVAAVEPWSDGLELNAGVLALRRATPATVLMGRVTDVLVDEGDAVEDGDVLARIDSRDVAARVAQAEAGVAAARAMEHNARLMLERMRRLHSRQAASQKDLDDAEAGHEAARASLLAAEEAVKAARVQLGYSEIRSPFAGFVVERRVEAGDMAAPGLPLFVVEDVSRVKVEAEVPESAAAGVRLGDRVEIVVQGTTREGRLAELVPAADSRSRTFAVRALLDNADGSLRSGMFARLRLAGPTREAIVVPESAIVRRGPLTGLFVVEEGEGDRLRARLRWVTLGEAREGRREVLTGLREGRRIVTRPPEGLEDGRPIEVLR